MKPKKIISILITICMVITVIPFQVIQTFAASASKIDEVDAMEAMKLSLSASKEETTEKRAQENSAIKELKGTTKGITLEDRGIYEVKSNCTISTDDITDIKAGITIPDGAKVTIIIKSGVTLTVKGKDGNGSTGAAPGIYVPVSSILIIAGEGKLVATGGNAGLPEVGKAGTTALYDKTGNNNRGLIAAGNGGDGGNGGGGAAAGIGGYGGNGGQGGKGAVYPGAGGFTITSNGVTVNAAPCETQGIEADVQGVNGGNGGDGECGLLLLNNEELKNRIKGDDGKFKFDENSKVNCGTIYVVEKVTVNAAAGKTQYLTDKTPIKNGDIKNAYSNEDWENYYSAGVGGAGGYGQAGQTPRNAIGAGGAGGAGAGGGGCGATRWSRSDIDEENVNNGKFYPTGGNGASEFNGKSDGRSVGTQKGGNGGNLGSILQKYGYDGMVFQNNEATITGRNSGEITKTAISFDKGDSTLTTVEEVTDLAKFSPKDGKHYIFKQNLDYTNPSAGGNGITIPENATVIFDITPGVNIKVKGGNAYGMKGAGAGVYVPESSKLIITGGGTLTATGGNAANGTDGARGYDAKFDKSLRNNNGGIFAGNGGVGGVGGGGAGAGIGGKGGNGGLGGAGGVYSVPSDRNGAIEMKNWDQLSLSGVSAPKSVEDGEDFNKLFDNNVNTKYCVKNNTNPVEIVFRCGKQYKVGYYYLTTANDTASEGRLPENWTVYGSNDLNSWTQIDSRKNNMDRNNFEEYSYMLSTVRSYEYYKFVFEFSKDSSPDGLFQLSEIRMKYYNYHNGTGTDTYCCDFNGGNGAKGESGTSGTACGEVYIMSGTTVKAIGGSAGASGKNGANGSRANDSGSGYENYYVAGSGGGGGAGAGGLAPDYGIGGGGAGGVGGGGGGAGSTRWADHNIYDDGYPHGGTGGSKGVSAGSQKGGDGGAAGDRVYNGASGTVYIDYEAPNVTGRPYFYHNADLDLDESLMKLGVFPVKISGYSDLILGGDYVSDNVTTEKLYYILREIGERGKLKEMSADKLLTTSDKEKTWTVIPMQEGGTKAGDKGVYKIGREFYKDITDFSGGYVYLFSLYFAKYIKAHLSSEDNPMDAVINADNDIKNVVNAKGYKYDSLMKTLMDAILYHENYTDGGYGDRVYTKNNKTSGKHITADGALSQVDYSYTTVYDAKTLRFSTIKYDTKRTSSWNYYYYYINSSTFKCVDGYKGVTMKNWMDAISDDVNVAALNVPGTHDSGTYDVKLNDEFYDCLYDSVEYIVEQKTAINNTAQFGSVIASVIVGLGLLASGGLSALAAFAPASIFLGALAVGIALTIAITIVVRWATLRDTVEDIVLGFGKCQDLSIKQQLASGIRSFDIRLAYHRENVQKLTGDADYENATKNLKLAHGALGDMDIRSQSKHEITAADCYDNGERLTFYRVINMCKEFLAENKGESVYLYYQEEGKNKGQDEFQKNLDTAINAYKAGKDKQIVVLEKGQKMPTVGEARGKIYLIPDGSVGVYENNYDVNAGEKIGFMKKVFAESDFIRGTSNGIRIKDGESFTIGQSMGKYQMPRLVYASSYCQEVDVPKIIFAPDSADALSGTPREIAVDVNNYLDDRTFQRGQYYGWVHTNFPTETATENLVFSNVFDANRLKDLSLLGSALADLDLTVLFTAIVILAIPAIAIPVVVKKRKRKVGVTTSEETSEEV